MSPFLLLPLPYTESIRHKGYAYPLILLQPKHSCWNASFLLSGLGGATCGQRVVKGPWMLHYILVHSIHGWSSIMLISRGLHSAVYIISRVPYTRLVSTPCDSSCPPGCHTHRCICAGMFVLLLECLGDCPWVHAGPTHGAMPVNVPSLSPWTLNLVRKSTTFCSYVEQAQASVFRPTLQGWQRDCQHSIFPNVSVMAVAS